MAGSGQTFIPPALHELESEGMEELWHQGCVTVRAVFGALNARNDAALMHFARRMASLDPQRRQQLNDLAHRG